MSNVKNSIATVVGHTKTMVVYRDAEGGIFYILSRFPQAVPVGSTASTTELLQLKERTSERIKNEILTFFKERGK